MKLLTQKGFSALEGLLILVVIGIIGGVGYFVFQARDQSNQTAKNTSASQTSQTSPLETTTNDTYAGWTTYTSRVEKMTFKYPDDWAATKNENDNGVDSMVVVAPSKNIKISWIAARDGIGGGCDENNAPGNDENAKLGLSDCPYFFVLDKQKLAKDDLYAVFGVMLSNRDNKYTPWCALQSNEGIVSNMSSIGYLLFRGKNNAQIFNGQSSGNASAGLYCDAFFQGPDATFTAPLAGSKADASKYWSTDEGKQVKQLLLSAQY